MAIDVVCPNGHRMSVPDQFGGKSGKCSKCGVAVVVPNAAPPYADDDPGYEVVADDVRDDAARSAAAEPASPDPQHAVAPQAQRAAVHERESKPARTGVAATTPTDRRKLMWIGAGCVAGFCAIVVAGGVLVSQFRSKPKATEPIVAAQVAPTPAGTSETSASAAQDEPSGHASQTAPTPLPGNGATAENKNLENSSSAAEPQPKLGPFPVFEFAGEAKDYAYDPKQGLLAIVGPWHSSVGFISSEDLVARPAADRVQRVEMEGTPTTVAYVPRGEGGVFVVGQRSPDRVVLLDAASLKPIKSLNLAKGFPRIMSATSNPECAHVYVGLQVEDRTGLSPQRTVRVDVNREEIETFKEARVFRDFAVSPDGELFYQRSTGSSTGISVSRPRQPGGTGISDQDYLGVLVSHQRDSAPYYHPHPLGRYVATGNTLHSTDLMQKIMAMKFDPLAFMRDRPWAAGLRSNEFVIGSANDGRVVERIVMPDGWLGATVPKAKSIPAPAGSTAFHPQVCKVFADETRNRFVLGLKERVIAFPLDKFTLPDESLLMLPTDPPPRATVGDTYEFSLQTVAGKPEAKAVKVPAGMRIEDGFVRWKPEPDDFGSHDVRVRLTEKGVSHDEAWQLKVKHRKIDVSFRVTGCDASTDGKQAVVWGFDHKYGLNPLSPFRREPLEDSFLAIVDLGTGKTVVQRKLNFAIGQAEWNATGVYVAPVIPQGSGAETMQVARLSTKDLGSLAEQKVGVGFLVSIGDRFLIYTDRRGSKTFRYSLPELKPVDPPVPGLNTTFEEPLPARRLADGWLFDGTLWNDELKTCKLLIAPLGFEPATRPSNVQSTLPPFETVLRGYIFDRLKGTGPRFSSIRSDYLTETQWTYVPNIPARLELANKNLEFSELNSQKLLRAIKVAPDERSGSTSIVDERVLTPVVTTPDYVLLTSGGETTVVPGRGKDGPFPEPFRIAPRLDHLVLTTNKPTKVTYSANGATNFELWIPALNHDTHEFKKESNIGTFEIDLKGVAEDLADSLTRRLENSFLYGNDKSQRDKKYLEISRVQFHKLTGKPPTGVPVVIHAYLKATSKDLEISLLHHAFLVDLPASAFKKQPNQKVVNESVGTFSTEGSTHGS